MQTLITLSDISAVESMSSNIDFNKKLRPHILDAQELDIRPFVGEEFWIAIYDEITDGGTEFDDLWNGSTYQHQGRTHRHCGLKHVLVMFTVARYKPSAMVHDTPFGLVNKTTPYSNPVSDKTVAREEAKARSAAEAYWLQVRSFLVRNRSDYPLFKCSHKQLTGNGLKFKKASKY